MIFAAALEPAHGATPPPVAEPESVRVRDWDRTDRRLRWGMAGAGVPIAAGAAILTTGLVQGNRCHWQCGIAVRGVVATGTALTLAGIAGISALAGLRRTARRTRTWSSGRAEPYYRRSRWMAGFGIGAGAGLGIAVAGAVAIPVSVCRDDFCETGRPWVVPTAIGSTLIAAGLVGLGVHAARRRQHRSAGAQVMFTGTGLVGRF